MRSVANTPSSSARTRCLKTTVAVVGCAVAVAACGSSSDKPDRPSSSQLESAGLKFAECMRSHGVANFPDPTSGSGGHGFRIQITPGIAASPAFKAAQSSCQKLLPGGGPGAKGAASPQARRQMLAISTCMRAHGITDFPDPTTTPPPPSSGNYSAVMGRNGVFLAIPSNININSPAFEKAGAACHFGPGPGGH
jgi:hypothetical protein